MAAIEDFLTDATRRMDKSIESTRHEFNSVRTGRASAALLDRIVVDYYGQPTPLKNLATISASDPRRDPEAELLPELTHREAIERGLKVMDTTALSLCMDNNLPIYVFALANGNIRRVISGERVGTIISTPAKEG